MTIHNHRTRLSTGVLKRKYIKYDSSDNSNNCDSQSDTDDDESLNNENINSYNKEKLYNVLYELFPSKYTANKVIQANQTSQSKLVNKINKIHKANKANKFNKCKHNKRLRIKSPYNKTIKFNKSKKCKKNENYETNSDLESNISYNKNNNNKLNLVFNINKDDKTNSYLNLLSNLYSKNHNKYDSDSDNDSEYEYGDSHDGESHDGDSHDGDSHDGDSHDGDSHDGDSHDGESHDNEYSDNCMSNDENSRRVNKKYKYKKSTKKIKEPDNDIVPPPKKISDKNYKEFNKLLDDDDNESQYFKNNLSINNQKLAIEKLNNIKKLSTIETPYLIHLIDIDIPNEYKACALRKINTLRSGSFGNSEYYKIKSWVDAFIKLPFNKYNNLPITFADGIDKCHEFMETSKKILDNVVYGLEDAKIQIMQLLGLWLVNPNAVGSAIAIKGPMGTGKTTLIKYGISKILNRPFSLIALGGCGDSGYLDGHDFTYEGSKYGKIIDILIQAGCMNPVILFDELDKISDSAKGEEITGVLTHLTDTTQNSNFTDKYMSEISLDMSKALFIFSYNDESKVNSILKDRMYKIETKGYKLKDKLIISKNYLLTKIQEQTKFNKDDIIFNDTILEYIINEYTEKESGVRNLKRCLEIIYTKLNLYRLMKPNINLFESSLTLKEKVEFPFILTQNIIDGLLNKPDKNEVPFGMYN